jgi:hypothetical protein
MSESKPYILHGQYPPKEKGPHEKFWEYSSAAVLNLVRPLIADKPTMSGESADRFIQENVHALEYKNTTIITVDHDSVFETHMNDHLRDLIQNPQIDGVVVEYFSPELSEQAKKIPIIGSYLASGIDNPSRGLPLDANRLKSNGRRLNFAKELSQTLASSGKEVTCVDIANKPAYMMLRELWTVVNMAVGGAAGSEVDKLLAKQGVLSDISYKDIGVSVPLVWRLLNPVFQMMRVGIYNTKQLSTLDSVQLHMEDARRLIAASGLKQKLDREGVHAPHKTLLVVYPKAHNMRIRNYFDQMATEQVKTSTKIKELAYRLISSPILDLKERMYHFSNGVWQKRGEFAIQSLRSNKT